MTFEESLSKALKFLRQRDRTEAEVREHLHSKGVEDCTITNVIERLVQLKVLDDAKTINHLVEIFVRKGAGGYSKLIAMLLTKGLTESESEETAQHCFSFETEADIANRILQKLRPSTEAEGMRKLASRGFRENVIEESVRGYFSSVNHDS